MYKTATAIVTNLISLIEEYGFVPNGARAYYTNRRYSLFHQLVLFHGVFYPFWGVRENIGIIYVNLTFLS